MQPQPLSTTSPGAAGLRRADTAAAFLADPIGSSIAGHTFVIWSQTRERIGAAHKGGYDPGDASTILSLFPIFAHPQLAPRYDILHDLSDITSFEPEGFQFFDAFMREWIDYLALRVRRVAVVAPSGLPGAAFTGMFHTWLAPRLDARLCESRAEAYSWLAMSAAEAAQIDAQREALAGPTTLRRLREAIACQLGTPSLSTVAKQLGRGVRTLQRELAGLGTSFRDEVLQVRIATAKARLLACNDKVECIARAVGFASTAAFSASFHKVVGLAPTAFRARNAS
jgi:AraC-like DNA-binding protein